MPAGACLTEWLCALSDDVDFSRQKALAQSMRQWWAFERDRKDQPRSKKGLTGQILDHFGAKNQKIQVFILGKIAKIGTLG